MADLLSGATPTFSITMKPQKITGIIHPRAFQSRRAAWRVSESGAWQFLGVTLIS